MRDSQRARKPPPGGDKQTLREDESENAAPLGSEPPVERLGFMAEGSDWTYSFSGFRIAGRNHRQLQHSTLFKHISTHTRLEAAPLGHPRNAQITYKQTVPPAAKDATRGGTSSSASGRQNTPATPPPPRRPSPPPLVDLCPPPWRHPAAGGGSAAIRARCLSRSRRCGPTRPAFDCARQALRFAGWGLGFEDSGLKFAVCGWGFGI
jgi:hypothetical protein